MEINIDFLLNKKVEDAKITHDYLQLFFYDSSILNIFNSFKLNDELQKIKDSKIISIQQYENILIIGFSSGITISIDMSEDGFQGPEAMEYCLDNNIIVIN